MEGRRVTGPIIMAMKVHPCTGKSVLAWSLAQDTLSTLIALDCVRDRIAALEIDSPTNRLDDLCFDAICRTTARQLGLGLGVIIDSPLSTRAHLDRLLQLSNSTKSHLVIVECKPLDSFRWQQWVDRRAEIYGETSNRSTYWYKPSTWDDLQKFLDGFFDYDTGDVSKIVVNTTDHVKAVELSFAVQMLTTSPQKLCIEYRDFVDKLEEGVILSEGEAERQERLKREEGKAVYEHVLALYQETNEEEDEVQNCWVCPKPISGPTYKCTRLECDLRLHKSCAELPHKTELKPQDFPNFLQGVPREFTFPKIVRCRNCQYRDYRECPICLFESFVSSALLPSVLHHPCHEHLLQVKIMPITNSFRSGYRCEACGDPGEYICYHCYECGFECHLGCGLLPHTYEQVHHRHPLTVTFLAGLDDSEEYLCDACETFRNPKHWIYYCAECEFHCHLKCKTNNPS